MSAHQKTITSSLFYGIGILFGLLPLLFFYFEVPAYSLLLLGIPAIWLAFSYPFIYVVTISALVPLSIQIDDIGGGLGLSLPTEPMMVFFFVILLLRFLLKGEIPLSLFKQPIFLFTTLYLIWYFITTLSSSMFSVSIKSFLAKLWFVSIFFYFLHSQLNTKKNFLLLLYAMLGGGVLMVIYTLFRHAGEGFVRLHSYTIMRPFFNDHGIYAAFIAFFVPILYIFSVNGKLFKINKFWRIAMGAALVTFLVGILFSYTRATWLSIVAMLFLGLFIKYGIRFKQIVGFLLLIFVLFIIKNDTIMYELSRNKQDSAEQLEDHIKSVSNISTDPSNLERINRWKSAVEMAKERPLMGFGPYTYTFQYAPYQRPEDLTIISTHAGTLGNAHSEYFMALSEMGIPGLLLVISLFLSAIYIGIKLYRNAHKTWIKTLAIALCLGLFTYFFHALLNNYSEYDKISVPMWSFLAMLSALDVYVAKYPETKVAV